MLCSCHKADHSLASMKCSKKLINVVTRSPLPMEGSRSKHSCPSFTAMPKRASSEGWWVALTQACITIDSPKPVEFSTDTCLSWALVVLQVLNQVCSVQATCPTKSIMRALSKFLSCSKSGAKSKQLPTLFLRALISAKHDSLVVIASPSPWFALATPGSVATVVPPGFCTALTSSVAISVPLFPVKSSATRSACHRRTCQTLSCLWINFTMLYQLLCFINSPFLS